MNLNRYFLYIGYAILVSGCSPYFHQPLRMTEARIGAESSQHRDLISLPPPREKIIAAVYKFRDQTGQYKDTETGTSWSTAVTQGSTSILLRAMEESRWFVPIERESLSNLLNERKIIRSSRASFAPDDSKDQSYLPPLLFAGILLEGGIVSFDSNILTGGAGARYFGAGAATQYREDRVTIYLRAVSTANGRVLKTVYTSKTILSQKIDVNFFRFVSVKRLLEAEMGFTYNEPGEMAIREAIEKAVVGLIIEGVQDGYWALQDSSTMKANVIQEYLSEKNANESVGLYRNEEHDRRGRIGVGISAGAIYLNGDYSGSNVFPVAEISLDYPANSRFSGSLVGGYSKIGSSSAYEGTIGYTDVSARYRFFNRERFTPYIKVGFGSVFEFENNIATEETVSLEHYYGIGEIGGEFLINDYLGISGAITARTMLNDNLDRVDQGRFNDLLWQLKLGLSIYLAR